MKRIHIIFTSCLLLSIQQSIASDPVSLMNAATSNLVAAQSSLTAILGLPPVVNPQVPNQPAAGFTSSTYKNTTSLPIIISLTVSNIVTQQNIASGGMYTNWSNPTEKIAVGVHADLSAVFTSYNPAASYAINVVNNEIELAQTSDKGKTLINNSGWPMLLSFGLSDKKAEYTSLETGHRYQPDSKTVNITIIPMISDTTNSAAALKPSSSILNKSGQLAIA